MNAHPAAATQAGTPHRHPMLLLDRLERLAPGRSGRAVKVVSANETHREGAGAQGAMPLSLVVDALGQLAIAVLSAALTHRPRLWYLSGLEDVRWHGQPPAAGGELEMQAEVLRTWRGTSRVAVKGSLDGRPCVEGVMILTAGPAAQAEGVALGATA